MTLKMRIFKCSRRLFIILVSLTVTLFSDKMLISTRCIRVQLDQKILKGPYLASCLPIGANLGGAWLLVGLLYCLLAKAEFCQYLALLVAPTSGIGGKTPPLKQKSFSLSLEASFSGYSHCLELLK